jgi:hypothetical protein
LSYGTGHAIYEKLYLRYGTCSTIYVKKAIPEEWYMYCFPWKVSYPWDIVHPASSVNIKLSLRYSTCSKSLKRKLSLRNSACFTARKEIVTENT